MTGTEFMRWVRDQPALTYENKEAPNGHGIAVKITNTKNGRYHYFNGPFDGREIRSKEIIQCCINIGYELPPDIENS